MRVEWVPYGPPAAEALRAEIAAAKAGEPLRPVTVVVPSNHVGVAARRMLARASVCESGVGVIAVTFVTVYRLAEMAGAAPLAGSGRRPVSTPVIAAALRRCLAEEPGVFAPVADHPATEEALVGAYRALRDVSDAGADAVADTSRRAADVVRLCRQARRQLETRWYDEEDLLSAATIAGGDPVIVYLPQQLSQHAARLLAGVPDLVVVAGTTGDAAADADVVRSVARLGGGPPPALAVTPARSRTIAASDADEEVRAAVRTVVEAARGGTRLDRMAILYAGADPYARLVHEQLGAAGIAVNGASVTSLRGRVAGRFLLELLTLRDRGYRRQDVLGLVAGAPVDAPVDSWERISRRVGVVGDRADWARRLAPYPGFQAWVLGLIDDLDRAASSPHPWDEHARWARGRMSALLGSPSEWPAVERAAAERVDRALDRLAALAAIEGPVGLDVFTRTLELELDADLGRTGRFGEGVLVGPVSFGLGLDLDLVVVLGLAEGMFPAPLREDSLLQDNERAAAGDELDLRSGHVGRQHRWLLAALSSASTRVLGRPRGDLRRNHQPPASRWAGSEEVVASYWAGLAAVTFPPDAQQYRLRALLAAPDAAALVPGADVVIARRSTTFTRFDGYVGPGCSIEDTTATGLETWVGCPFAYFVRHVLRVRAAENPEDHLQITALDRGDLVHRVLQRFYEDVLDRPPPPDTPWRDEDRARMLAIADDVFAEFEAGGLTGRPLFWDRDRISITGDLLRILDMDDDWRRMAGATPIAAEMPFAGIELVTPSGAVRFTGKADRVDRASDGTLHVIDYKTGKANGYARLAVDNPDADGTCFQLPVYALAARAAHGDADVTASYWFVSSVGRWSRIGYDVTPPVLERVGRSVGAVADGIAGGVFPHHPTAGSSTPRGRGCPFCDPDGLGVVDLRRAWDRKRDDPALAPYAQMVEPDA